MIVQIRRIQAGNGERLRAAGRLFVLLSVIV
jgi:hypothetical protein